MVTLKKGVVVLFTIVLLSGCLFSTDLTLFGSYNIFLSSGSASDYVVGENEFPITDSHDTFGVGVSFNTRLSGAVFGGIEAAYNVKSTAVIRDPSDNDSAEINTYPHALVFATLGYRFLEQFLWGNKISWFARVGTGMYYLPGTHSTESYTTANNYLLEIEPAGKKIGFAGFVGAGAEINVYRNFWIVLSGRYLYIASEEPQGAVVGRVGLRFLF